MVDLKKIKKGKLNLIEAPPGSGKTTFAAEKLPELASNHARVLYLIDTTAGKEQLLKHNDVQLINSTIKFHKENGKIPQCYDKIIVMTYAYFGTLVKFNSNFTDDFDVIVCDELHNIFWPINLNRGKLIKHFCILTDEEINEFLPISCSNYIALEEIKKCITNGNQYVVGLSATPKRIFSKIGSLVEKINADSQLIQYETFHILYYKTLELLLNKLQQNKKGIIYVSHIIEIKKYVDILRNKGIKTEGIWSLNNHNHPMSKHQIDVRNYIIQYNKFPDDVDVLFINKSSETSLNIFTKLDYMIIHSSDEDVQVQARGRFRGDLNTLYLLDRSSKLELPMEMLSVKLYKKDVDKFIMENNLRNNKGELMKQPTFKKLLIDNSYEITEGRDSKSTYFIAS